MSYEAQVVFPKRFVIRDNAIRARAVAHLQYLVIDDKHPIEVTFKEHKGKRSDAQNRISHLWYREVAVRYAETRGKYIDPRVWKMYFKRMFLGEEHHEINGLSWDETRHTADLNVKEMSDFLNQVDHYCGSELQISLPHPSDLYAEAMGRTP